jgi:hypothetical protein
VAKLALLGALERVRREGGRVSLALRCGLPESTQLSFLGDREVSIGWGQHVCDQTWAVALKASWDRVAVEHSIRGADGRELARLDIALLDGDRVVLGIEVCASHSVPDEKRMLLALLRVPWVEVDVRDDSRWRWALEWTATEALPVARASHGLMWRCADHARTRAVELVRYVDVMVPPKEGERAKRVRVVFLMCGEYGKDGLTARVLAVWMGRLVALAGFTGGAPAGSGTLQERQAKAFAGALSALAVLSPGARVVAATGWLSLMEVEPKGRLAVAMLGAVGSRHPCRVRWSEEAGDWVEASADLSVPDVDSRPLGALAAFALGQDETVYQRVLDSRGGPPRWSAEDEKGRQAWDDAEMLARSLATLFDLPEGIRAGLSRSGHLESHLEAVTFALQEAGLEVSDAERAALAAELEAWESELLARGSLTADYEAAVFGPLQGLVAEAVARVRREKAE